jgi:hypothetical protein
MACYTHKAVKMLAFSVEIWYVIEHKAQCVAEQP